MLRSQIKVAALRRVPHASSSRLPSTCVTCTRSYAKPTTPASAQPALAEATGRVFDPAVFAHHNRDLRYDEPHKFNPHPEMKISQGPGRRLPSIQLPSPLPMDVPVPMQSLQAELYKPTSTVDTIAMLSICSSRSEFVPRAYQIFTQLLDDAKAGIARLPPAEVFANVIKGVAALGEDKGAKRQSEKDAAIWRHRALQLVWEWETTHRGPRGIPMLEHDGVRVYRGWFAGLVSSGSPLDSIVPYIENPNLGLNPLLANLQTADLEKALEKLAEFAQRGARADLMAQISELQGIEQEKREFMEREVVPEVSPVLVTPKQPKGRSKVPDVKEADLSLGPQARFTITNLRDTLTHINSPLSAFQRQMDLERASYAAAEAELAHSAKALEEAGLSEVAGNSRLQRDSLQGHMHRWHVLLTEHIEQDIKEMRERVEAKTLTANDLLPKYSSSNKVKDSALLLYLTVLPPKKLALITILEIMRMVGSGGVTDGMKTLRGVLSVGKAVETEHRAETIRTVVGTDSALWQRAVDSHTQKPSRKNIGDIWTQIGKERVDADKEGGSSSESSLSTSEKALIDDLRSVWTPPWSQMVQMSLGSHLVESLIKVAKVPRRGTDPLTGEEVTEDQPAFNHEYEYMRGKKLGVIRLNPVVASRLAADSVRQVIHPKHLPMLVPPRPWTQWNDGAYLATPVTMMRFKDSIEQMNYLKAASQNDHLTPVFHGLDVLSSTPWRINRGVFDVVLEAWNSGEAIGDIPATPEKTVYNMPEKPDPRDTDPAKRSSYVQNLKMVLAQQRKDHGERCKYNYNLEIARSYLNDVFYIPHNMDFRGRAYPIPPHLSPVGDDLCRGLLTFGVKKPLGSQGLKWLQIQLANVTGYDKASFEDRAKYAQEHEDDIFDSADNPLTGRRWWLKAEDPWQCLAVCMDLAAALRSPDPTKYESSLPVHQDGTCNGMQHYAALGGDVRGAKAVNLEKGDRPADIYTGVADLVNASIEEDRKNNVPVALLIDGTLGRKVVKQTVMTTVYGVTFIGARDQIAKQLIARGGLQGDDVYLVSGYVARKVLDSIGDLFSGARAIQDWLTMSARLVAKSIPAERLEIATAPADPLKPKVGRKKPAETASRRLAKELMTAVVWTTPLGLPVVQPYRKAAKKQVMTSLQTVFIHDPNAPAEVSPQKQATAFPPNFVHSLDATHMLLTAVQCNQSNIQFASVHDSYWTHASTVEPMSEVIRDTFIHLHTQNLIGELHDEFLERYGDNCIPINKDGGYIKSVVEKRKASEKTTKSKSKKVAEVSEEAEDATASLDADADIEDGDPDSPIVNEKVVEGAEGIDLSEVNSDAEVLEFNGQKFVRFRDILPRPPPRGVFDVEKIRDSAYFFS
ncbi:DNA-directed RNA polymerase [Vanrija albida]|uniref:DNA-directed RNA polymerase n=1 Tax=Vanrija albida TaxID=181172 RepID=A0ABR3Q583_9TREE